MSKPADLPNDVETLKALLVASEDRNLRKQDRIDQLEKLVSDFKRALFGAKSEKADPEQFELSLKTLKPRWPWFMLKTKRLIRLHRARQNRATPIVGHCQSICPALKR